MEAEIQKFEAEVAERWAAFESQSSEPDQARWLAAYLKLMYEVEQDYRRLYVRYHDAGHPDVRATLGPKILAVDQLNQERLAALLEDRSWPTLSEHGAETCEHAWMIALHADSNLAFQKKAMSAIEPLFKSGEIEPVHYAALSDRIAINEDRPQHWGMFYKLEKGVEVLYPVDEPGRLEARRAELGLGDTRFRRA